MSDTGPRLRRLEAHHDLSSFDCGEPTLNNWLGRHALAAQRTDSARTFLLLDGARALGYFSLTMGSALRKAVAAGDHAAARLLVVDALHARAAAFYRRWGFVETPEQPLRLYRRLRDIRASLDQAEHRPG